MSILEELFDGTINPSEKIIKKDSNCQILNEQLDRYTEKLIPLLSKEGKELFSKIEDTLISINQIYEKEAFIEGFRLGTQIICEAINYKSTNFLN